MQRIHSLITQYLILIAGLVLLIFGTIVLTGALAVENPSLWLPALLVVAGALLLPAGTSRQGDVNADGHHREGSTVMLVAVAMLCVGFILLLRQFGVITVPILRYLLGGTMVVAGLYGIFSSVLRIGRGSVSSTSATR